MDVKRIERRVEERKRISLDSFLEFMEVIQEMREHGTKRIAGGD